MYIDTGKGEYKPPSCFFNSVVMRMQVTSRGRQFDRLGHLFLDDIEVFRTSTAEPTQTGIHWQYDKDMSLYLALWRNPRPQKVIFDLGNLIDEKYTASYSVLVSLMFSYAGGVSKGKLTTTTTTTTPREVADIILPISAAQSHFNASSAFTVPAADGSNAVITHGSFPSTTYRALISIAACGQMAEEFWYTNVLSSDTETFKETTGSALEGFSSFREIQLLIDGLLAGAVWPFPLMFTGGISPLFWRPMVGIDAFDIREEVIDISPFIPLLTDGRNHTFEMRLWGWIARVRYHKRLGHTGWCRARSSFTSKKHRRSHIAPTSIMINRTLSMISTEMCHVM